MENQSSEEERRSMKTPGNCSNHQSDHCSDSDLNDGDISGNGGWENEQDREEAVSKLDKTFMELQQQSAGMKGRKLNLLNWPLLETRRARVKLHLLHKAKSQSIEIPTTDLEWEEAPPQSEISINRTSTRSSRLNYPIPHSNVNSHLHSFFPSTVRLWNSLPEEVQSLKSYSSFQQTLNSTHISRTYTTL